MEKEKSKEFCNSLNLLNEYKMKEMQVNVIKICTQQNDSDAYGQ